MVDKYFNYQTLSSGQIRLLRLEPATSPSAQLRGELIHQNFSSVQAYEALSYTWGAPEKPFSIHMGDSRIIPLTANLNSALRHLRHQNDVRTFWIDQICINQIDTVERSAQVLVMDQIYTKATRVVIWIGEMDAEASSALDFLPILLEKVRKFTPDSSYPPKDPMQTLGLPVLGAPAWQGLSNLFSRPYFRRVWIVQEVVLAKEGGALVKCGLWEGDWEDLALASRQFEFNTQYTENAHDAVRVINGMRLALHRDGKKKNLSDVLFETHFLRASNPRDKIYSILGLTDETDLAVDYTLTEKEVYTETAKHLIEKTGNLDIISCVVQPKKLAVPSWVPDWTAEVGFRERIPTPRKRADEVSDGNAANLPQFFKYAFTFNTLHVSSIQLGAVESVTEVMPAITFGQVLPEWSDMAKKARNDLGISFPETYWRALIATDDAEEISVDAKTGARCYEAWQNVMDTRYLQKSILTLEERGIMSLEELNQRSGTFHNLMESRCIGRRFMLSGQGQLVLGPEAAKPGDRICAIYNCSAPLIYRPVKPDNAFLIGACYVQGHVHYPDEEWARRGGRMTII